MKSPVIVKLGGSAITEKSKECTPCLRVLQQAIDEISSYQDPLIILHGGGSYAHPIVAKAGLRNGYKRVSQLKAISETEFFLDQLTRIVGVSLMRRQKPFVPLDPMSFMSLNDGEVASVFLDPVENALKIGLTPLIHGDLAFDSKRGVGIVSADRIASYLGIRLRASRVLFGCDVDGVFSQNPKIFPKARLIGTVTKKNASLVLGRISRKGSTDVTGGMRGKVDEAIGLAKGGVESYVFNLKTEGLLSQALRGELVKGTRFLPWRKI